MLVLENFLINYLEKSVVCKTTDVFWREVLSWPAINKNVIVSLLCFAW